MQMDLELLVEDAVQKLFDISVPVDLTRPEERFGDYSTNIALQLSKTLGKSPREIATALQAELGQQEPFETVEVAGPGFLNFTLTNAALAGLLVAQPLQLKTGQKILVEYSDPNPLKPLHAGHLYTTLVGDSIARLLEVAGATVVRLNYGGDVGLHVGKSLWAIIHEFGGEYPEKLADISQDERPSWLGARYVEGNNAYDDDEQAKQAIKAVNKRVYELHSQDDHDSPFAQIYWTVRQWSYDYFGQFYEQLRVTPFDRYIPESVVTQLGLDIVRDQLGKGVYRESQGAVVFEGEPYGLHTRVFINSEGLPTYEAKDVGLLEYKWQLYHFDESIVITANEQAQYYEVMLKSVEQFAPQLVQRSKHLTHGVVKLAGGEKMSSRRGNIVSALDIIEAARQAGQESGRAVSEETTLAAIKYAFAKNRIGGDIVYDPQESIALEGNSGPYLQYAHARARSILGKAHAPAMPATEPASSENSVASGHWIPNRIGDDSLEAGERSLLRKITEYAEVVDKAVAELMPHHICTYLYELAQSFNSFYEHNRVLGDEREALRLQLVTHYADTLKRGLELLGIAAPEHM